MKTTAYKHRFLNITQKEPTLRPALSSAILLSKLFFFGFGNIIKSVHARINCIIAKHILDAQ